MTGVGKKKPSFKTIERIKNVLLVVLFVSSVFFATAYIIGTQHATISPDTNMPLNKLLVIRSGNSDEYAGELNKDALLPEFFAYKIGGNGGGLLSNRDLMRDVNRILSEYYANLFSDGAVCSVINRDEADRLWTEALEGNYIYVKYPGALPYPLINAYHTGNSESSGTAASSDVVYADELLIVFENDGSPEIVQRASVSGVYAISRSDNGECAVYKPDANKSAGIFYDTSLITAYNGNKSFVNYRFADETDAGVRSGVPLTDDNISANVLEITRTDPVAYCENITERNKLLRLFSFNPDNLSSYSDTGALVFVAGHGSLRLYTDGRIAYGAADENGGVELSGILGYGNYGGEYTVFESLKAACGIAELIGRIDQMFTGGSAELQLSGIEPSGAGVTFIFSYFFNNLPLRQQDGSSEAMTVTVENNRITAFTLKTLSVTDTLSSEVVLPAKWVNENIYLAKTSDGELSLAYIIGMDETSGGDSNGAEETTDNEIPESAAAQKSVAADETETQPEISGSTSGTVQYAQCGWIFSSASTAEIR